MSSLHCLQNVFFLGTRQPSSLKACMLCRYVQLGGFGGWWAWFPQGKVCIFSGKNFVILQTASQDWCLEDGYLKFSCWKKTLPRCHVISGTACLCLNPISSVFSLRKMDLKKLHDATLPINWCKSYPRQSNCSGSIVFCFNNFPKGVGLVVL